MSNPLRISNCMFTNGQNAETAIPVAEALTTLAEAARDNAAAISEIARAIGQLANSSPSINVEESRDTVTHTHEAIKVWRGEGFYSYPVKPQSTEDYAGTTLSNRGHKSEMMKTCETCRHFVDDSKAGPEFGKCAHPRAGWHGEDRKFASTVRLDIWDWFMRLTRAGWSCGTVARGWEPK